MRSFFFRCLRCAAAAISTIIALLSFAFTISSAIAVMPARYSFDVLRFSVDATPLRYAIDDIAKHVLQYDFHAYLSIIIHIGALRCMAKAVRRCFSDANIYERRGDDIIIDTI